MMFNELEIIAWCYTIYLLLTYEEIGKKFQKDSILKFRHPDELVLASAIFAKVSFAANYLNGIKLTANEKEDP